MYLLYLITDGKFHKIGITNRSIQARIKQLQTGNPYELKLIKVVNCGSEKHAQEMEKFYHNKYYEYRMQGEWFDFKKFIVSIETGAYPISNFSTENSDIPLLWIYSFTLSLFTKSF